MTCDTMDEALTELISNNDVCRTAPAKPGILIIMSYGQKKRREHVNMVQICWSVSIQVVKCFCHEPTRVTPPNSCLALELKIDLNSRKDVKKNIVSCKLNQTNRIYVSEP